MKSTKNIILMNYKFFFFLKEQSHILNKNHHITKITTCFIFLKIRKKKWSLVVLNLGKNFNMWLITFMFKKNNLTNYLYFYDKNYV